MKNTYKQLLMSFVAFGSFGAFAENTHDPVNDPTDTSIECSLNSQTRTGEVAQVIAPKELVLNAKEGLVFEDQGLSFVAKYNTVGAGPTVTLEVWASDEMIVDAAAQDINNSFQIRMPMRTPGEYRVLVCKKYYKATFQKTFHQIEEFKTLKLLKETDFEKLYNRKLMRNSEFMKRQIREDAGEQMFDLYRQLKLMRGEGKKFSPEDDLMKAIRDYVEGTKDVLDWKAIYRNKVRVND
jgi:hypothetical protein